MGWRILVFDSGMGGLTVASAIRAEPLTSAIAGSSWRTARTPSTTSPSDRSATAVSPRDGSTRSM